MQIIRQITGILFFVVMLPFMLAGWVAAVIWAPIAAGFFYGNKHIDALYDINVATYWTLKITPEEPRNP